MIKCGYHVYLIHFWKGSLLSTISWINGLGIHFSWCPIFFIRFSFSRYLKNFEATTCLLAKLNSKIHNKTLSLTIRFLKDNLPVQWVCSSIKKALPKRDFPLHCEKFLRVDIVWNNYELPLLWFSLNVNISLLSNYF